MSTSQGLHCVQCKKSVDLIIDLITDESGKAVHEQCYVDKIIAGDFVETSRSRLG
jgi:hypothetical protein